MLSHLRFHRRGPSNPSSPVPEQAPAWDAVAQREHLHPPRDVSPRRDARPRSPNTSQLPPTLPPITRVASTGSDHFLTPHDDAPPPSSQDAPKPQARPRYDDEHNSGFIGGVALQNLRRASQTQMGTDVAAAMAAQLPENQLSRANPPPPPIQTSVASRPPPLGNKQSKSSWFSTPTDLQGPGGPGKRLAGPRLASEPTANLVAEPPKGRKGLPFLKNPMSSLLMRRKGAQASVETQPPAPTYDPRIKGTRVHDFSAPRPKKPDIISVSKNGEDADGRPEAEERRLSSGTLQPGQPTSLAPLNDESSLHTSSSAASRVTQVGPLPPMPSASASVKTTASRQLSAASKRDFSASAIPKHMKSTSSRFSFDMIGAAEQERVLEERHRQREQERKTSDDPDARFDDFDEEFDYDAMMDDDGLEEKIPGVNADYDDYNEYEEDPEAALDPDNDQVNFAGFVFQRSNPVSSLTSPLTPGVQATPRDASGNVIGFAMSKDTPPTASSPMSTGPVALSEQGGISAPDHHPTSGQGTDAHEEKGLGPGHPAATNQQPPRGPENDDIYFDDGLADELDFEHDGTVFDESIFDINDTDKFGRPIPGAFAQAKEAMQAAQRGQPSKRNSDLTSSTSGQSGAAQSTGQTSLSVGPQPPPAQQGMDEPSSPQRPPGPATDIPGQDLAYQAALAEAAQKAAASGKFARSTSPETLAGLTDTYPDDPAQEDDVGASGYIDDYANDDFANDFDDFDFDDEAIIAEANASALANDADGFYGQEFGFYSAPIPQPPHANHHHPSASLGAGVLTTENLFQYANGGYFGPASAGLHRSTSGRVVREPNLTPITERSEYSNRNSVMSFTLPPAIGSGGGGGSDRNSLTSPGLAQLALLPADDADPSMSLSALMKLRSRAWGGAPLATLSGPLDGGAAAAAATAAAAGGGGSASSSPYGTVPAHLAGHVRVNSGLSLWSCSEAAEEEAAEAEAAAGLGEGGNGVFLPPRPGSAGAVVNGSAGGGANGLAVAPLPQRPQSLFLLPMQPTLSVVSSPGNQQQQVGLAGSACSPVLEGEETNAEGGTAAVADGFALAPALPLRTKDDPLIVRDGK
ncbi:hypothetical protein C7999DRAFT_44434 [Corynascus novoguineensis]|uniref:Uncharacterized protein n=1 Tax=Corynascus novoguineensis TaxID=1126955 RepID=A0AAN7HKY0_9PEZI|nr:hypothetical protein C7999DRAFT_44434 [Corynascus novoguineensis]